MPRDGWRLVEAAMKRREALERGEVPEPELTEEELTKIRLDALRTKYVVLRDRA